MYVPRSAAQPPIFDFGGGFSVYHMTRPNGEPGSSPNVKRRKLNGMFLLTCIYGLLKLCARQYPRSPDACPRWIRPKENQGQSSGSLCSVSEEQDQGILLLRLHFLLSTLITSHYSAQVSNRAVHRVQSVALLASGRIRRQAPALVSIRCHSIV